MNSATDQGEGEVYRCERCSSPALPPVEDLARVVAAAVARGVEVEAWWIPAVSWELFQAGAVSWLRLADMRCEYHAAVLGAIVVDYMRRKGQPEGGAAQLEAGG